MNTNKKVIPTKKDANSTILYQDHIIKVYKELNGEYSFDTGKYFTTDVTEAVAILMKSSNCDKSKIWNENFEVKHINPINTIYWLSGGDSFWKSPDLNISWNECFVDIVNKFQHRIYEASKRNKLSDIRKYFKKHLNLDTFYEYALSKGII